MRHQLEAWAAGTSESLGSAGDLLRADQMPVTALPAVVFERIVEPDNSGHRIAVSTPF